MKLPQSRLALRRIRVAPTLARYRRAWLAADLLAAATLLVIAIPEQLATSRLAGMPPITGFYAFAAGTAMFALLGTNPRMSVGADSTIAPLFAVGVARLALPQSARYVDLVGILAVMVGVILVLVWLLRLGWVAEFLSAPIITGFLAGVAVVIVVHQLPELLGVRGASGSTIDRVAAVARQLGHVRLWDVAIGAGVLTVTVAVERLDRRLPAALVALAGSTALVAILRLHAHGVAVLGSVAHAAPRFGLVGVSLARLGSLAPLAGIVALVVVTQSAATTRAFPPPAGGPEGDVGTDLLGVGAGNVLAGLIGAFPVDASPPRTAAVASARGRTQASGLLAAAALMALVPAAGVLSDVPLATLAGVLVLVAGRIFRVGELVAIGRFDAFEAGLAVVTLVTVAIAGVEPGIGVAVGLAILDRTRLSARPQLHVLGRIPGTTSWAPVSSGTDAAQVHGVLVVLFATPLWYANATHFRDQLRAALARGLGPPRLVVLDALGMSDIDFTGSRALAETLDELDRTGIGFAVARAGQHVHDALARAGLLTRIGKERFFPSVDEAVVALTPDR